ncbi:sensor histidine kinase [Pyxidicoccus xibeiensis]|uniref:sensor histidine kinase n=1 Tax=Pyxidicoccus xibeiensis TaxID=2906759 RepID=UPI0020A6DED0|nr:ATP-binding protein [Pyxidicoccus xibeiensis]MCP3141554.1 ATP-binding protein [Pyxidicoccus xibeiensis]
MYPVPENEQERLRVLRSFARLGHGPEQEFEAAAALAAQLCNMPIGIVSVMEEDREWFKGRVGVNLLSVERADSFCTYVLAEDAEVIIPDALLDERFAHNRFVVHPPFVRSYAGFPLRSREGAVVGTLCVLDHAPRTLSPGQREALRALARQVSAQMELKRSAAELARRELVRADSEQVQEELIRLLVAQSSDGFIVADEHGVLRLFNPEAERQHGVSRDALFHTRWPEVLGFTTASGDPMPSGDAPLARALAGEQVRDSEWAVRRRDGSIRLLNGTATPLHHPDGRLAGAVLITRDITEQRRTEQALQEAVRMREEFLSIASHELRTPLATLSLQATSLLRAFQAPPELRVPEARMLKRAESLKRQVARLEALVSGLLDVSRLTSGKLELQPEEVDLRQLAEDLVERFSETAEGPARLRLDAPLPVVGHWDRLRLEQVLTNLVTNALRYGRDRPVEVRVEGTPAVARLQVRDEGIGIAEEAQERIFGRFERAASGRNYGGLGLGLWLTRQLVEAMQGSVSVRSRPGEGSTFTVELPRH